MAPVKTTKKRMEKRTKYLRRRLAWCNQAIMMRVKCTKCKWTEKLQSWYNVTWVNTFLTFWDEELRRGFRDDVLAYEPCWHADKTGTDCRDSLRRYGWVHMV